MDREFSSATELSYPGQFLEYSAKTNSYVVYVVKEPGPASKVVSALSAALFVFVLLDLFLQVRTHLRYGQSVFNRVTAETEYVVDSSKGLKLLRPNRVFGGSVATIRTNSLGLRNAEIDPKRQPHSLRLAVVGASTVMGAYAADNDKTLPALLEAMLRQAKPDRAVEVINAGIAGYTLDDERAMLEKLVWSLNPDRVIVYPGFNDFSDYCRSESKPPARFVLQGLPELTLPNWLLTVELISKNTVFLRNKPSTSVNTKNPRSLDLTPYRRRLERLFNSARRLGMPLAIATNARAYRPEQPIGEQERLSESARYVLSCFDVAGLHTLYDLHNGLIRDVAHKNGVPVVPLDERIPGGSKYFADASHFNDEGEQLAARTIFASLTDNSLIDTH
jgi:lysophospholipase L1-like esterase